METKQIIEALQTLENFSSRNPHKLDHFTGTDDMGPYEYFAYGTQFSTPNLHEFIRLVSRQWDN
jgi:hypothetical protein